VETVRGRKRTLPGLELIPSPGHCPGGQSVAVETKVGRVIIAGFCSIKDNFYPRADIREKVSPMAGYPVMIPGIHFDAFKAYQSVCKIKKLADLVLPIHDPGIMDLEVVPKS
jgi:glyoxylase-like metal-dependent hydrolase (beta-lactamase superfamily II)